MTEERHAQQGLPPMNLHDPAHDRTRAAVVRRARWAALGVVGLLLLGLGRTLLAGMHDAKALESRSRDNAVLHVLVTQPQAGGDDARLSLPGTLQGAVEAQMYARASGYVRRWHKDIGDPVRKGELLATLDLPEVDRQVDEAKANYELARSAFERWTRLRADDAVSQQELDEKTGAYRQSEAVLKRLRDEQAFGQVLAPFDGTVTRRNVNVGDLVNAGAGNAASALFSVAQIDKLHVYLYVPQDRAALVHVGDSVDIVQPERPERPIRARIARSAGAIDLATRTLQIDVDIPNPDHALLPGAYVDAQFRFKAGSVLTLPPNTLLFGAAGTQVAVVRDGKVQRQTVTLGTDYGRRVEIRSGIAPGDQVVVNPPDAIVNGQAVVVEAAAAKAVAAAAPATAPGLAASAGAR